MASYLLMDVPHYSFQMPRHVTERTELCPYKIREIREIRAKKKEKSVIPNPNNDNKESLTP